MHWKKGNSDAIGLLLVIALVLVPRWGYGESLSDLLTAAKSRSPSLQQQYQLLQAERQCIPQAKASLRPQLSLESRLGRSWERDDRQQSLDVIGQNQNQNINGSTAGTAIGADAVVPSSDSYHEQRFRLTASVPIFDPQSHRNIERVRSEAGEALWQYTETELNLYSDVLSGYFELVRATDLYQVVQSELTSSRELAALSEARYREDLGNRIDVLDSNARSEQVAAELTDIGNQMRLARIDVARLTGRSVAAGHTLVNAAPNLSSNLEGIDDWLLKMRRQNPTLKIAEQREASLLLNIKAAHADHYPTLNLSGSLLEEDNGFNARNRDRNETKYELALVLNIPLYQGGRVSARNREIAHRYVASQYARLDQFELLEQRLRSAWQQTNAQRKRVGLLQIALSTAQEAQQLHRQAQREGLESQLDTLRAERELFDIMRSNIQARSSYLNGLLALHTVSGDIGIEQLGELRTLLAPTNAPSGGVQEPVFGEISEPFRPDILNEQRELVDGWYKKVRSKPPPQTEHMLEN